MKNRHDWIGKVTFWELYKHYNSTMPTNRIYTNHNPSKKNRRIKYFVIFWYQWITNSARKSVVVLIIKHIICSLVELIVPAEQSLKIKANEWYPNSSITKLLWDVKVTVIAIVDEAPETVSKGLEKRKWGTEEELTPYRPQDC